MPDHYLNVRDVKRLLCEFCHNSAKRDSVDIRLLKLKEVKMIKEILIFASAIFLLKFLWRKRRFLILASKIPKSKWDFSLRGIVNALTADNKTIFKMIYESFDGVNGLAKTWIGPLLFVIISKPEDVKIIFNAKECFDKPYFVKYAGSIPQGSLFGSVKNWQSHRKILDPYFGLQKVKNFLPLFDEKSKVLCENVGRMIGKGEFDIYFHMTALTLEIILNTMELDVDIQNLESHVRDVTIKGLERASKLVTLRMFRFWLHPDFVYRRTKMFIKECKAKANSAFSFTDDVIKNIQATMSEEIDDEEKPKTFMRALMSPKFNLPNSEIRDEIKTLLIAAQDTSGISMSATLLLLAMHKDKQDKVAAELKQVLGNSPNQPIIDYETINQLQYLEMVINESLRLIPVVPFVFRSIDGEITSSEGYIIPANSFLVIPIFKIHRNTTFWGKDADEFKPERFEKENFKKIHQHAFLPFTKGPRMCLGYRYAMLLMKIQLANFLMRYEVDTTIKYNELEFELSVTVGICQGFKISIKKRRF